MNGIMIIMEEQELEQLDYELAREYCVLNNIEEDKLDAACMAYQAGRISAREECERENENCVIIHLDNATDDEQEEIAERLAEWMNDNYSHLAQNNLFN